jgi:hypothetical protein
MPHTVPNGNRYADMQINDVHLKAKNREASDRWARETGDLHHWFLDSRRILQHSISGNWMYFLSFFALIYQKLTVHEILRRWERNEPPILAVTRSMVGRRFIFFQIFQWSPYVRDVQKARNMFMKYKWFFYRTTRRLHFQTTQPFRAWQSIMRPHLAFRSGVTNTRVCECQCLTWTHGRIVICSRGSATAVSVTWPWCPTFPESNRVLERNQNNWILKEAIWCYQSFRGRITLIFIEKSRYSYFYVLIIMNDPLRSIQSHSWNDHNSR